MQEILSKLLVFATTYLVKIHRIEKGNFVTWDEAHFGKFSQKYLSRIFYFDVHPPLGKMLTALSGFIHGQSAQFDFGSSAEYPVTFDYVGMRRFHAFIASFTPLFGFLILREFKFSLRKALLLSLLFILENGVVAISRLILLDSHLITFTAATAYVFTLLFTRVHLAKPGKKWRESTVLAVLGICIGCVMSIKWIGCLTTLQVGIFIIFDLFIKLLSLDIKNYSKYLLKRIFFLICIPSTIYIGMFYLHFFVVNQTGPDDGFMSSEFQLSLKGNSYKDLKKYVSYGNQITLRSESGYLHSHFHSYPDFELLTEGISKNNLTLEEMKKNLNIPLQVTTYSHSDSNNNFYFQKLSEENADFVTDQDNVALLHNETKGYIQLTLESAYMSDGYKIIVNRMEGLDPNAVWVVEIESDSVKLENRLKAVSSKFYLKNKETGMYLCASTKKYPTWGFSQGEICGVKEKTSRCLFNLQENFFSNAEGNVPYTELRPSFVKRFLEHQVVMWNVNKSFVADPDLAPEGIVSQPMDWLMLKKGIRMSQWHAQFKFYMFMNPLIHYCATLGLLLSPIILYFRYTLRKRKENQRKESKESNLSRRIQDEVKGHPTDQVELTDGMKYRDISFKSPYFDEKVKPNYKADLSFQSDMFFLFLSIGGWALHFIPFFIVGRVLYMHHYFPALFFGTLNLCFLLRKRSFLFCFIFVGLCALVFAMYSPLTYGFIEQDLMKKFKIRSSWNFTD